MARTWHLTVLGVFFCTSPSFAQNTGLRFQWRAGQALNYRVEHQTTVSEVVGGNKLDMISELTLHKRWDVSDVDAKGVATLKLTLVAMRNKQSRPSGETVLFDSANPEKSTPELREQMSKFIGRTLAVLRVDGQGKVVEVKQGQASRYDSEPPFTLRLPEQAVNLGQAWERKYEITLDPPLGTGEKYQASQRYRLTKADNGLAAIQLTTTLKTQPDGPADRIPLLQKQPEGEILFNSAAGRVESVNLRIEKSLEGHQGQGSSYRFSSTYKEQYVGGK